MDMLKRKAWLLFFALLVANFLVVACGTVQTHPSMTSQVSPQQTGALLLHWNPTTSRLTVSLSMTGLTPFSSHLAQIRKATSCLQGGSTLFPLHPVVADAHGVGTSITDLLDLPFGIPRQGWTVNISTGLAFASQFPLTCIVVHNYSHMHGEFVLRYDFQPLTAVVGQQGS